MKYIVLFEDNPDVGGDIRQQLMPEHLSFLQQNKQHVNAAGPLITVGGEGAGGLWVVEANSEPEVQRLVEADPFWPTGLRNSVRVLVWKQVFADGSALARR